MSDERLREAERRWKETGSVEDEARYLQERVRAGTLTLERLELAAYCGHEAASKALGTSAAGVDVRTMPWVYGLDDWVKDQQLRREVVLRIVDLARSWIGEYGARALDGAVRLLEERGDAGAAAEEVVELAPWLGMLLHCLNASRLESPEAENCMFLLFGTLADALRHQGQSEVDADERAGEILARECAVAALGWGGVGPARIATTA